MFTSATASGGRVGLTTTTRAMQGRRGRCVHVAGIKIGCDEGLQNPCAHSTVATHAVHAQFLPHTTHQAKCAQNTRSMGDGAGPLVGWLNSYRAACNPQFTNKRANCPRVCACVKFITLYNHPHWHSSNGGGGGKACQRPKSRSLHAASSRNGGWSHNYNFKMHGMHHTDKRCRELPTYEQVCERVSGSQVL